MIRLLTLILLAVAVTITIGALAVDNTGTQSCKACHLEAWKKYSKSPHAHSMRRLTKQQKSDERCLVCHSLKTDEGTQSVGCESCHGPGQYYKVIEIKKDDRLARALGLEDPTIRTCRRCHTESSSSLKPFDYDKALKSIKHWPDDKRNGGQKAKPEKP